MEKPDRTEVIERLNRILKSPMPSPPPRRWRPRLRFVPALLAKRRLITAQASQ